MSKPFLTSKQIALVALFAALQAILGTLPFTVTIGVSGQITLGVLGGPLIGIILGPFLGSLAVLIGSLLGVFVNPVGAVFGVLTVLPPTIGAAGAGFIMQRRGYVPGAIILGSLLIFFAHPFSRGSLYPWLHIVAMAVSFVYSAFTMVFSPNQLGIQKLSLVVPIAAFVGTVTDHMFGSALAIWYFNPILTSEVWNALMFIYPLERIVAVVLISLIGVPLLFSLRTAGLIQVSNKA